MQLLRGERCLKEGMHFGVRLVYSAMKVSHNADKCHMAKKWWGGVERKSKKVLDCVGKSMPRTDMEENKSYAFLSN